MFFYNSFCQKIEIVDFLDVQIVDSLSNKENYLYSEFYLKKDTEKPFTGIIVSEIYSSETNLREVDSVYIKDGYRDGFEKNYLIESNGEKSLIYLKYISQQDKLVITRKGLKELSKETYTEIVFYENLDIVNLLTINYYKGKVKLEKVNLVTGKKCNSIESFKDLSELEHYFISKSFEFNELCKRLGVFKVMY